MVREDRSTLILELLGKTSETSCYPRRTLRIRWNKTSAINGTCRGLFIPKEFQEPLKSRKSLTAFQQPTQRPLSLLCTSKNSPLGCRWPEILAFCVKTLGHYFQADTPFYKQEEVPLLIGSVLTYLLLAKECVRTWTGSQSVC